jgi:hypothetical protein
MSYPLWITLRIFLCRVWKEGGYEGGSNLYEYGHPALRLAGDIEDRIAVSVHKL